MRVAIIDIGSNSTRLLVADVRDRQITEELERRTSVTRLGEGVDVTGRLSKEAMDRVYATLDEYQMVIDRHNADPVVAVFTSAVRDASNGKLFADSVARRYGLAAHVLSGDEEAYLTFLGATSERDRSDTTPTVVIDIGGGSTELVIGAGRKTTFHVSNQAGVVRQTERHLHHDPPEAAELEALAQEVAGILDAGVPDEEQREAVRRAIAVAGTATALAAISQQLEPYESTKVHGYILTRPEIERLLGQLAAMPLEERRKVPGLHPDRAPTIVAGAIILLETLRLFDLGQTEVSEHDILRGAAIGMTD